MIKKTEPGSRYSSFLFYIALLSVTVALCAGLAYPSSVRAENEGLTGIIDRIHTPDASADFRFPEGARVLRVAFPVIKECDSCLVTDGENSILIDCATDAQAEAVLTMLRHQGIRSLGAIFITHPHPDHCGGLDAILQAVPTGAVYTCFSDTINDHAARMKAVCEKHDVPLKRYKDAYVFDVGDAHFITYATDDQVYSINDRSAAFRMQYGKAVMFFAADLERLGLRRVGKTVDPELLRMDIIKYPHHGKDPLVHEFWEPAKLRFAVVTSDATPRDGKRDLKYKKWAHAFTADGEILLQTDGDTWLISYAEADSTLTVGEDGVHSLDGIPATIPVSGPGMETDGEQQPESTAMPGVSIVVR